MNQFFAIKTAKKTVTLRGESSEITFRQLPFGMIMSLHKLGGPLSKLLSAVLVDKKNDISASTTLREGVTHTETNEVSPTIATLRSRQLEDAIQGAFDAVLSPDTEAVLCEVLLRGTADVFDDDTDILKEIGPEAVFVLLKEIFILSAGDFSSLGKLLPPEAGKLLGDRIAEAIKGKLPQ
jgi:hypothetical protein